MLDMNILSCTGTLSTKNSYLHYLYGTTLIQIDRLMDQQVMTKLATLKLEEEVPSLNAMDGKQRYYRIQQLLCLLSFKVIILAYVDVFIGRKVY